MPLVCLAGTLPPFADAAEDVLRRFAGVRLSASTVLRSTEGEGERLRAQQKEGRMVEPTQPEPKWTAPAKPANRPPTWAWMRSACRCKASRRARPNTGCSTRPCCTRRRKNTRRYLVDFELDALAEQVRSQARALGIAQVSDLIAITDGGNGLEEALQRHLAENLTTILDWYHAAEHLCDFAKVWHAHDEEARTQWQAQAKGILYEQGGEALLTYLHALVLPPEASAQVQEELRKLIGYFENNRHRTDYPTYRRNGWDIGSGPDGGGLQDHRRTLERIGHALGRGRRGHGGFPACACTSAAANSGTASGRSPAAPPRESHPRKNWRAATAGPFQCALAPPRPHRYRPPPF